MIKVDIISGFLGAGKTTLIKKLFESSIKNEQTVIIENEFGEIGIDGTFLKGSGVQIKEINAGCICCSLVGDFTTSIKEVISTYHPDRIIIEPSGVGKLSDIIGAITRVGLAELKLNILATVVAGSKAKIYLKNFGEFFINQVEAADTVVVTKLEKMSETQIDEVVDLIKEKNSHANVITTPISEFKGDDLLHLLEEKASLADKLLSEAMEEAHHHHDDDDEGEECCCHHHHHHDDDHEEDECCCHHHDEEDEHEHHHHDDDDEDEECCCHHHHHDDDDDECCCHHHDEEDHDHEHEHHHHHHHGHDADEIFTSWGKETSKSVSKAELEEFFNHLTNDEELGLIVRCKGILKANDKDTWYYFDYVSGDYEIREGNPDYTGRIVVIGSKIDEDKISDLFFKK